MPRQARIDAPGALHHMIACGMERREIFYDQRDGLGFNIQGIEGRTLRSCFDTSARTRGFPSICYDRKVGTVGLPVQPIMCSKRDVLASSIASSRFTTLEVMFRLAVKGSIKHCRSPFENTICSGREAPRSRSSKSPF
jgi:hypothetical protein